VNGDWKYEEKHPSADWINKAVDFIYNE